MAHQCCSKQKIKRGLWSPEEDEKLMSYITTHGHGSWSSVPNLAGLQRCGKSCRLRWINYLRPDLKRGAFTAQEERIIIDIHRILGNRWAQIAKHLPGRTDNEVKNYWNSHIKKKLIAQGLDPKTHNLIIPTPRPPLNGIPSPAVPSPFYTSQSSSSPFTITPAMKSFDTLNINSMVDLNEHLITLPQALPMSNFQYQDSHLLMNFKNQEPQAPINIINLSSSSALDHTNISSSSYHQPGNFIDEMAMWASALEPAANTEVNVPKPLNEVQQEQPAAAEGEGQYSLSKMDFNEVSNTEKGVMDMEASYCSAAFDLELEAALLPDGAFYNEDAIDQLQWDC